jgi:hypothetical protein
MMKHAGSGLLRNAAAGAVRGRTSLRDGAGSDSKLEELDEGRSISEY